jgi:hypothetical protein
MLSEYMKMEYFKITDVQQARLINNCNNNKKDKHCMDM